ncbi:hypothetical protein GQX74_001762 [Glossina fuscipes]|nr:hypothetical protein GQX74_001762 [Glossina fuscipes]
MPVGITSDLMGRSLDAATTTCIILSWQPLIFATAIATAKISLTTLTIRNNEVTSALMQLVATMPCRFDVAKHWLAVSSILLIIGAASVAVPLALRVAASAPFEERLRVALQLLDQVPLIDGHNDLPWNIRKFLHNKLNDFNFNEDLRNVMPWARSHWSHTDLTRLKKGRVSAQAIFELRNI